MRDEMIVIIDYGAGNVASIRNMLRKAGADATISASPDALLSASKLVLPGVGHFDHGMRELRSRGLIEPLNHLVVEKRTPILGICLGAQLFARGSEEGDEPGLGWVAADVKRFDPGSLTQELKVPHMGWNDVKVAKQSALLQGLDSAARFYFVHSFHIVCDREADILVQANHGAPFVAGVERDNVMGVQFHPEKSHRFGLKLLQNFADMP
jgi:glutamine amidotransferase